MPTSALQITSPAFATGATIPTKFTCDGDNLSPELNVSGIPPGTRSLALIMDDPDSPAANFVHWLLFNLPSNLTQIPEGQIPSGSQTGVNSFGHIGYGGPCPHQGEHRYVFTLYALDQTLTLDQPDRQRLEAAIKDHVLASVQLTGKYQRKSV